MDNTQEKKKKRFNFVDAILLLIILLIVGALLYNYLAPLTTRLFADSYDIEYTLQIRGIRREFSNKIIEGDEVVETDTLNEIGTVTRALYSASKFTGTDSSGRTVTNDYPGMYDVTITVRAKAEMPSGMYEVNGYTITAGKVIPFRVPDSIGEAVCVSVSEVKA